MIRRNPMNGDSGIIKTDGGDTVNGNGGSDGYDDYEKIAKAVAERLVADMEREADACGQIDVPASLDRRMEAMFALRRRKAEVRHRIFSAGAAAAVVLLVSVCCLRQSMSPGDAGWSYEIGRKSMIQIR